MHYYKKNIGDYHKKAGRLTMLQHGAYTLLMDACYDREEFPTIDDAIEWVWASSEAEIEAVKFVLSKFFDLINGVYIQTRIERELDAYQEKAKTNKRIAIDRELKRKQARRLKDSTNRVTESTNRVTESTNREHSVDATCESVNEPPPNYELLTNNYELITNNQEPLLKDLSPKDDDALEIFNHWKFVMGKNNASILNAKRKKAINARLKEGYTVEQIKLSVTGCSMTPHNMGQNDNGKKYDDIELICRDGTNVERFASNASQSVELISKQTQRNLQTPIGVF